MTFRRPHGMNKKGLVILRRDLRIGLALGLVVRAF